MKSTGGNNELSVEVVYAFPDFARVVSVQLQQGATVRQAIETSGLLRDFPGIDLDRQKVGIYSKPVALETVLNNGDRVEIYRDLNVDPKDARRRRAEKKQEK